MPSNRSGARTPGIVAADHEGGADREQQNPGGKVVAGCMRGAAAIYRPSAGGRVRGFVHFSRKIGLYPGPVSSTCLPRDWLAGSREMPGRRGPRAPNAAVNSPVATTNLMPTESVGDNAAGEHAESGSHEE